ncbi:unnamed protein product [Nesidiocoris tenuis]|uniref:E3 ubiquitin-protein ligase ZNRF1 n=1 Tax=Nesidiocoris tenuis TaxID=355587 RepID=A0A6H5HQB2_9HEMI|nr:unnamed protein product [Nesidiocoris tenuis]
MAGRRKRVPELSQSEERTGAPAKKTSSRTSDASRLFMTLIGQIGSVCQKLFEKTSDSKPSNFLLKNAQNTELISTFHTSKLQITPFHNVDLQNFDKFWIKCPVCSKFVLPDDIECHLVMCLTKPRLIYNEDVLSEDKGECVICLEELTQGDTIARLPCLCIYHKTCIDRWFDVNRSCPEHPGD